MRDHIIVCGYGSKGRSAVRTLLGKGVVDRSQIVVIDPNGAASDQAGADGLATVVGNASTQEVLEQAGVRDARSVIVAVDRDDAAVLITLTARELAPEAVIAASVREEENSHLLHQSGASSVITSSGAAGRLLGLSTDAPALVELIEDLLTVGEGLDLFEHRIGAAEAGPLRELEIKGPALAVYRNGEMLRADDPRAAELEAGDTVVELRSVQG